MGPMDYFIATSLSVVIVALCITVHYEVMNLMAKVGHRPQRHRWILMIMMYGLLLAHVVEIWIFGFGYIAAQEWLGLGNITGTNEGLFDYMYFSAMVYTTVGFGDQVPNGAIRMLASTEALAGFALITWSASFTFLQMQRLWRD
jgi:hypothetical protein